LKLVAPESWSSRRGPRTSSSATGAPRRSQKASHVVHSLGTGCGERGRTYGSVHRWKAPRVQRSAVLFAEARLQRPSRRAARGVPGGGYGSSREGAASDSDDSHLGPVSAATTGVRADRVGAKSPPRAIAVVNVERVVSCRALDPWPVTSRLAALARASPSAVRQVTARSAGRECCIRGGIRGWGSAGFRASTVVLVVRFRWQKSTGGVRPISPRP
jgi:hypothetical protein